MWVAMEATTLSSGPLLYFNRNARSLEATWKYLLIGSVGIALALLGSFFLGLLPRSRRAATRRCCSTTSSATRRGLSKPWLHAAFVLLVRRLRHEDGPGPDAHLEARRLRRGAGARGRAAGRRLTSCAFLALFRVYQI